MSTKKVKMSSVASGIGALERLVGCRFATYAKTREMAKYYGDVIEEIDAYNAEVERLHAEFPDAQGEEYMRRLSMLTRGEVTLDVPTVCEGDLAPSAELPSPADMFLLRGMIDFE